MNIHRKCPWGIEIQLTNPINYETITTDYEMAVCLWHNAAHIFCFMEASKIRPAMQNQKLLEWLC